MSATADTSKFANYFEKPLCGKFQPAPVIKIEESNAYAVDIHYLEELSNLGKVLKNCLYSLPHYFKLKNFP